MTILNYVHIILEESKQIYLFHVNHFKLTKEWEFVKSSCSVRLLRLGSYGEELEWSCGRFKVRVILGPGKKIKIKQDELLFA